VYIALSGELGQPQWLSDSFLARLISDWSITGFDKGQ